MDLPKPFVTTGEDNKLTINEEVLELLATVEEPIVIVAVVGYYRTGKSYLLNRLMRKRDGFPLGSSVQSKTKGIWIWLGQHPGDAKKKLLLIDTEGLSDPEKADRNHDIWIFSLAILLSSTFVYNSIGTIDNNSLNDLYMTSELTEHLKVKAGGEEEGTEFDRVFPMFIWAVRDFFLKQEIDGRMVSPDEYLEHCLTMKPGNKKSILEANNIKKCIRAFFGERHCFLFPCPASNKEKLQNLEKLAESDLEEEFINVSEQFVNFVFQKAPVKQVGGKAVNGRMFVNLSKCYVHAIRDGQIPCIESAVEYISIVENKRAKEEAIRIYDQQMGSLELPATEKEVNAKHQSAQKKALDSFSSKSVFDQKQEHQQALAKTLAERLATFVTKNEESSTQKSRAILRDLYKGVEQQVKDGTFLRPGGYASYMQQMEKLERDYIARPKKGVKANVVFNEFMQDKQGEQKHILHADKKLKEEEKKIEEERLKAARAEQSKKAREEELARAQDQMKQMEKHYEEGMRQYKEDLERKTEAQVNLLKTTMEEQKREHERLMREGFKEEAKLLKEQIENMQKEMDQKKEEADEMNRNFQMEMLQKFQEMNDAHAKQMGQLIDKVKPPPAKSSCTLQ